MVLPGIFAAGCLRDPRQSGRDGFFEVRDNRFAQGGCWRVHCRRAGDIVFTKNGGNRFKPWVLMHLSDVVDYYSLNGQVQLTSFRLKK